MPRILLSLSDAEHAEFAGPIEAACRAAGLAASFAREADDPACVDYIVFTPDGPVADFSPFTRLKAALSLWAGVERIVGNATLTAPLCRLVDPGLTEGMVEYVTANVLRYHLGLDRLLAAQDGRWHRELAPPLARNRSVGILGLGALGQACARALAGLNFRVLGWSRRPTEIAGVACHHGTDGLARVLTGAEILVTLLPSTRETRGIIGRNALARMPQGACLINPGRGPLVDDAALLAALDAGQLAHATLDVFDVEPLPPEHRFWSHPQVTVTPHIAAATRPETAAPVIAENVRRGEAGAPFLHLVDRAAGY